jgi:hypothetical protein
MALLPADLVGDSGRIIGRGQSGGFRGVGCRAARVGRHVGHASRLTCGPGPGDGSRIGDAPSRRMRPGSQGADPPDPQFSTSEGSEAVDGLTRACVARGLRLEQRQCPLGTVGGPRGQHSPVVLAQGQRTRLAFDPQGSSPRLARVSVTSPISPCRDESDGAFWPDEGMVGVQTWCRSRDSNPNALAGSGV